MTLLQNKNCLFLVLLVFLFGGVIAQETVPVERSSNKVILEGTVYYIHVVKPGQTLYAIAKAYNISQKELAVENPGVISGLQMGQALKIPVVPVMEEEVDTSELDEEGPGGRYHVVQQRETLYGISRSYELKEEDLLEANEFLKSEGLQPGQTLRIPDLSSVEEDPDADADPSFNEEGFIYHKVKRRETLYSIGKYYNVSVHDIRAANSELGWGGPKTGQLIRIPQPQVIDQPAVLVDTLGMDSLSIALRDSVFEEYTYDELNFEHDNRRRRYKVAYFIPFDFKAAEPLDTLLKDVKSPSLRNRIIERYMMEEKTPQAVNFLEFFQGSLLALDSVRQMGMKLEIRYFDTRKSVDHTLNLLMDDDLEDYDLFIGPFYPFNLEVVAAYAKKHKIPLVTPFYNDLDLIRSNPYLFQLSPSLEREYQDAARLIASKHRYNIVYVRDEDTLNVEKHTYFKQLIFDGFDEYHPEEPVVFKEVIQKLRHTDEIIHSLSPDKKNLVVVATRDEALASRVMSSLYYQLKDYEIEVLGTPFWTEFSSIELRYFHELNLIFYSTFWVDYLDPDIDAFMKKYRTQFLDEPTITTRKGINYGIIGYDMSFYFLTALRKEGPRFILSLENYRPGLVQNSFALKRVTSAGGYENAYTQFYQFSPDMKIRKIEVPEYPPRRYYFKPLEDPRKRPYLNMDRRRETDDR
jgi:LysM repeat protein